jgi:hypothetical protein
MCWGGGVGGTPGGKHRGKKSFFECEFISNVDKKKEKKIRKK